jgi:hypothetical protein
LVAGSTPSRPVASIGPYIFAGNTTSTRRPGDDGTSRTCTPCLWASSDTTDMPSVGSTDRPTIGGLARMSLSSTRRSAPMPTPSSEIEIR